MIRALALLLALSGPAAAADQPAQLIGSLTLHHTAPWFGGYSGLVMAPDGGSAVMISDRGTWARVTLTRSNGVAVSARDWQAMPIAGPDDQPMDERIADAEGLTRLPDGRLCISFEQKARIDCYDAPGAAAAPLPIAPDFQTFPPNGGLESLAADDHGRLYAIPEKVTDADGTIPVWRLDDGTWSVVLHLPGQSNFHPSDAEIFEGHLYVLLRAFTGIGFRTKLVRLPLTGGRMDVLLETTNGTHDNLEGLSLWRDQDGRIVASMVSDDNQSWLQSTQLVEYHLPEPPPGDAAMLGDAAAGSSPLAQGLRTK